METLSCIWQNVLGFLLQKRMDEIYCVRAKRHVYHLEYLGVIHNHENRIARFAELQQKFPRDNFTTIVKLLVALRIKYKNKDKKKNMSLLSSERWAYKL